MALPARAWAVGAFAFALLHLDACTDSVEQDGNQVRMNVFLCEEALARARSCCPSAPTWSCVVDEYSRSEGCLGLGPTLESRGTEPDIEPTAARCIVEASCEDLRAEGACEAAWADRDANGDARCGG